MISRTKKRSSPKSEGFFWPKSQIQTFFPAKNSNFFLPKKYRGGQEINRGPLPPRWRRACFQVIILALVETRITLIAAGPRCFVCQVKYRLRQIRFMSSSCLRNPHGKAAAGNEESETLKNFYAPIFFKPLFYHYRLTKAVQLWLPRAPIFCSTARHKFLKTKIKATCHGLGYCA